ncbi:MAG TPA: ferritin-like domain-containing protein [Usitatibacter sp.]|nr:ferritin-like domain-containing protein [Usitatibacter sp.]
MLYHEVFAGFEKVRWDMSKDIPWDSFDSTKLSDEQARTIKMNAITEWSALPATEMFLRDNQDDSDFSAFMSIWFYEEQKHALVLMEYLKRFRPELLPTEAELHAVRFPFDPAPALETLMLHFCGEIRLTQWYRRAASWHTEPVIKRIYETLAGDEARHAGAYFKYMRRAIDKVGDEAKISFAKIGILMASAARAGKPLHPTNLHVNKDMFPNDTVQSKLPDVGWLEHWLDTQIQFDKVCENKVVQSIFAKLGTLYERAIADVTDLKRFRKELLARLDAPKAAPA